MQQGQPGRTDVRPTRADPPRSPSARRLPPQLARALLSLALAVPLTLMCLGVLHGAARFFGVDWHERVVDTLLNTHLAWLSTFGGWLKANTWAPPLVVLAACALSIHKLVSRRLAFYTIDPQDFAAMDAVVGPDAHASIEPDRGIVPWVPADATATVGERWTADGWARQRRAAEALRAWMQVGAGEGFGGGVWPRHPSSVARDWLPLSLALLTGANGVGKSPLSLHLAEQVARQPDRRRDRLLAWSRTVLPWRRRRSDDPWDVGRLRPRDAARVDALARWKPRRPTLLLIDEPTPSAGECLRALEARREHFWHPVRVLLIDQAFPVVLDAYRKDPAMPPPVVPLEHGSELDLGDLRFDGTATRAMWNALCRQPPVADAATERKLWGSEEAALVADIARGNPLQIALVLDQLKRSPLSIERWYESLRPRAEGEDPASAASLLYADHEPVRHRLVAQRAADLIETYEEAVRRSGVPHDADLMTAVAAASVTGGLELDSESAGRLPARLLDELFPGRRSQASRLWIPSVRPAVVARAYLDAWVGRFADPAVAARRVAEVAWRLEPEGSVRATGSNTSLPASLADAMRSTPQGPRMALPWAQACVVSVLCDGTPLGPLMAAYADLDDNDRATVDRWLPARLDPAHHRPARPWGAIAICWLAAAGPARR